MKENNIFSEEIQVPEIVLDKVDAALAMIRMEGKEEMRNETERDNNLKDRKAAGMNGQKQKNREEQMIEKSELMRRSNGKKSIFKNLSAAVIFIALLIVTGITAAAALIYSWSRGMQGEVQATPEQQQELIDQGYMTVLEEHVSGQNANQEETEQPDGQISEHIVSPAVTDNGITVKALETICDGNFAYFSFSVEGYEVPEGMEPCFEYVDVYLGNDPEDPDNWVNMSGSFYDGIISGEDGSSVYEDGSPIAFDETGTVISHYYTEEGNLEFVFAIWPSRPEQSLIGETVHVAFRNLGTVYKALYENEQSGSWEFDITLSGQSDGVTYQVGKQVGDTVYTIESIELSPISAKMYFEKDSDAAGQEDEESELFLRGFVLADGTRMPYMFNGGGRRKNVVVVNFARVLDVEQVQSLIVIVSDSEGSDSTEYVIDIK